MRALLVGFEYREKFLPGIAVDLFRAATFARKSEGCSMKVVTDLTKDREELALEVLENKVGNGVLSFVDECKEEGILHNYIDREDFLIATEEFLFDAKHVFFYYSGHAIDGSVSLPDGKGVGFSQLLGTIMRAADRHAEIFVVLDCCGGIEPVLPFRMEGRLYRLRQTTTFYEQEVVCVSSSSRGEASFATGGGSIFSSELFSGLARTRSLFHLLRDVNRTKYRYGQTAQLHSSYPTSKVLWPWLGERPKSIVWIDSVNEVIHVYRA